MVSPVGRQMRHAADGRQDGGLSNESGPLVGVMVHAAATPCSAQVAGSKQGLRTSALARGGQLWPVSPGGQLSTGM